MPFLAAVSLLMTGSQQRYETPPDLNRFSLSARQALFFTRASVQDDVIELRHLASGLAQAGNALTKELLSGKRLELPEAQGLDRELPFSREVARALRNASKRPIPWAIALLTRNTCCSASCVKGSRSMA
jgi:hypothetical protein